MKLTVDQVHALGIIGGVAFAMSRRTLLRLAKELISLGLVTTNGAFYGRNRSAYHWDLTDVGHATLVDLVKTGTYPLARHTEAGRQVLRDAGLL